MNTLCGITATPRTLIAVVATSNGACQRPITAAKSDEARIALVDHLLWAKAADLVVCEELITDSIIAIAADKGLKTWVVPAGLLHGLCLASGIKPRATRPVARLLARIPLATPLRPLLRQLRPHAVDSRQTALL